MTIPSTNSAIIPFSDQLPENLSDKLLSWFLPRVAGVQKQTAIGMTHFKTFAANLVNLHYDLFSGVSGPVTGNPPENAVKTIVRGVWGSRWPDYMNNEPLFMHTVATNNRKFNGQEHWYLMNIENPNFRNQRLAGLKEDIAAVPGTIGWFADETVVFTNAWFGE